MTVNELVTVVNIVLETATVDRCPSLPLPTPIDVSDIVGCVTQLLEGCSAVSAMTLFSPDAGDVGNPFPTDRLRDDAGHVRVSGAVLRPELPAVPAYDTARALFDRLAGELGGLTGFSTWGPIRIKFDRPVRVPDAATLSAILLVRYDDGGTIGPPVPIDVTAGAPEMAGDHALEIKPRVPLEPKTRYVYVVTTAVRDVSGSPVRPTPELSAALHGRYPPSLSAWLSTLQSARASLQYLYDIAPGNIALIDFFTTQATTDDLTAIKDRFVSGDLPIPVPQFDDALFPGLHTGTFAEGTPEFTEILGTATSETIAAVVVGTFASFDFRFGQQQPFDPARVAGTVPPGMNHIPFYLTIPKAPPPADGYPIVMFAAGLLNGGRDIAKTPIANVPGPDGMMGIAISGVQQAERGDPYRFFNVEHAFATRDNFRQTVADYLQLERMIRSATVAPFDAVDKSRVHFMGGSLGGMLGTLYMGIEPDVVVGMIAVPGGGLPDILHSSVMRGLVFNALTVNALGVERSDPWYPALERRLSQVLQWAWDPADPINTAPFVIDPVRRLPGVPPKRILMQQGLGDTFVPNRTTDDLVRAMGLPDAMVTQGCSSATGCSGLWRFDPAEYGVNPSLVHLLSDMIPEAAMQSARFLLSGGTEIIDASRTD